LGFPNTFFKLLQLLLDMAARLPVGQSAGDYRGGGSDSVFVIWRLILLLR